MTSETTTEHWSADLLGSIQKMLNPRSIAIVGATPRLQYGGKFLKRVLQYKDRIKVYAVNPKYEQIFGEPCYPSIDALPEVPDVAAVIVPYHAVLATLQACSEKGVASAIVISAGFAERGDDERRDLQLRVGAFAKASGVRMSGPNCLGLANVRDDLFLTSSTRVERAVAGPVGIVCQSGASLFGPFLARATDLGLGMSYAVSTGNEADLEFTDFARYLLDDEPTRVIAAFIEGFKSGEKFVELAKLAALRGKPIVMIKIGRSDLGSRAAGSHTAALTGSDALYDAVCKQYGVIRAQNYDDLLEISNLLARVKRPIQRGIALVSHSGGVSSLCADLIGLAGLDLPPLTEQASTAINAVLKGFGWASNPADVTGKANSDEFPLIAQHLIDEPTVGTLVVASAGGDEHADHVIALRDRSQKNVVYMWTGSRSQSTGLPKLLAAGVPVFFNADALARGLRHLFDYHDWRAQVLKAGFATASPMTAKQAAVLQDLRALKRTALSESESKRLVAAWGVPMAREERVDSADAAVQAAERIGYPVVLKVDSPDILHKTEAKVLRLRLQDAAEVRAAYDAIMAAALAFRADARITGVLVQEMVAGGVETIVGVSYDAQLGPTLLFGTGGVMVEVYKDVALRRCPVSAAEARAMVDEVKGVQLLKGFRGQPAADIDALVRVLVSVSQMAVNLQGQLAELDINPLMVLPAGQGVKAVDGLVLMQRSQGPQGPLA